MLLSIVLPSNKIESSEETVSLRFLQPAGISPKIFTDGWVFAADCILPPEYGKNINSQIHWSGTGNFYPEYGTETHPVFEKDGINTITAEISINGKAYSKTYTVFTVNPENYSCAGDWAHCPADNHGCPTCTHDVIGRINSGSPTVKVRGKPAARLGDGGTHGACCGDNTFTVSEGDDQLLIDGKPAAKIGGATQHCGGTGVIVVEDIHKITENFELKPVIKEVNTTNVYFPAELVPNSYVDRLAELKRKANAEAYLKMDGPDYTLSRMEMLDKVNEIFGLESATLSFMQEVGELECLEKINGVCGKIGILFSAIEVINNVYEGKKTDAVYNSLKAAGYYALDCGWSSLKIATFAVVIIDYTLKTFLKGMIDSHYDEYKRGFYSYYNTDDDVKRNFRAWKVILDNINEKSNQDRDQFQSKLDEELNTYFSHFWNPEVYNRYLPGFKGELSSEERNTLQESYKQEILSPMFNVIYIGYVEKEKRKIDKEIKEEIKKLVAAYNTKIPFTIKVNGPADRIKKVNVKIGEWSGHTDDKGIWKFDATLFAYLKNKKPETAIFVVGPNDEREVKFVIKNKNEIVFNMPKPVTLNLAVSLSKETEGAVFSAISSANNFDQYTIPADVPSQKIEWVWKINGIVQSTTEGGLEMKSNQTSGTFEDAETYTVSVELINRTEGTNSFNNPIASATKRVTVKKDKNKEKEKEKVVVEKKEATDESNVKYLYLCPNCSGQTYNESDIIKVEIFPEYLGGFTSNSFEWQIDNNKLWKTDPNISSVLTKFTGGSSFIFPYKKGQYRVEVKNSSGKKYDRFVGYLVIE